MDLTLGGQRRSAERALLVAGVILTGLSMRTAVTSVGAVLAPLQSDLRMSSLASGALTTMPVICFALIGAATPRLAYRLGGHVVTGASMAVMAAGCIGRVVVDSPIAFIALSIPALSGSAVANVMLPILVKHHFPNQIGRLTAVYVAALSIGQTLASGLTVPAGSLGAGWRTGLGIWAVPAAVAVIPWLWPLPGGRAGRPTEALDPVRVATGPSRLLANRAAWVLTVLFAAQSFQAYDAFGWFARVMSSHGVSGSTAGWMVALLSATTIPVSLVVPLVPRRWFRALAWLLTLCSLTCYTGLLVAPVAGAWFWMVLSGIGLGMFPLVLTLIGLRSRTPAATASLSGFVQSIGYGLAGTGPLLFGALHPGGADWTLSLATAIAAAGLALIAAYSACRSDYVDDL